MRKPYRRVLKGKCAIEDCTRPVKARGWCSKHYDRWATNGDPLRVTMNPRGTGNVSRGYRFHRINDELTPEHVLVAEKALGRKLPKGALVHHVNENGLDNRNENLVICPSQAYHMLIHARMRAYEACGNANWRKCHYCKRYDDVANLIPNRTAFYHQACNTEYVKTYLAKNREKVNQRRRELAAIKKAKGASHAHSA